MVHMDATQMVSGELKHGDEVRMNGLKDLKVAFRDARVDSNLTVLLVVDMVVRLYDDYAEAKRYYPY